MTLFSTGFAPAHCRAAFLRCRRLPGRRVHARLSTLLLTPRGRAKTNAAGEAVALDLRATWVTGSDLDAGRRGS